MPVSSIAWAHLTQPCLLFSLSGYAPSAPVGQVCWGSHVHPHLPWLTLAFLTSLKLFRDGSRELKFLLSSPTLKKVSHVSFMNHHYYNIACVLTINTTLFFKQKDQPEVGRERKLLEYFNQVKYLGEDTNLIYIEKWMMKNTFLIFVHLRHSSTAILKVLVAQSCPTLWPHRL